MFYFITREILASIYFSMKVSVSLHQNRVAAELPPTFGFNVRAYFTV